MSSQTNAGSVAQDGFGAEDFFKPGQMIKKTPDIQYLCRTCGHCCKVLTTSLSPQELKKLAELGNEEAKVFTDIFKPYNSIEEARKVLPKQVANVIEVLNDKGKSLENLVFYYCPHQIEENKCEIYQDRPGCCRRAPKFGWSAMPPGCGFEGWQFEQREYEKKIIRKLKEFLYLAENIAENGIIPGNNTTLEELRLSIAARIEPWKDFGAEYW